MSWIWRRRTILPSATVKCSTRRSGPMPSMSGRVPGELWPDRLAALEEAVEAEARSR
jgi:hypothetical protein